MQIAPRPQYRALPYWSRLPQTGRRDLPAGLFHRPGQHVHHQRGLSRHRPRAACLGGAAGLDQHGVYRRPDGRDALQCATCCLLWQQNRLYSVFANFFLCKYCCRTGRFDRRADRLARAAGPGRRPVDPAGAKHDLPAVPPCRAPWAVVRHHAGGLAGAGAVAGHRWRDRRWPVVALDFLPERPAGGAGAAAGRPLAASRSAAQRCARSPRCSICA